MADDAKRYTLIAADGKPYSSPQKGTVGGHRGSKIFGRLDCPAALRAIAQGGYVKHRVFFADPVDAIRAGYRPCAVCMPDAPDFATCRVDEVWWISTDLILQTDDPSAPSAP
jgi:methylphosphotriester-DNA--protein-cysteine methyltransferase